MFLLSVNCFAAVVADNDGSAFITKAEFDSLKNDFQSQLDTYNTSIDSKIDAAISSYLAGIKADKVTELTNLYANITAKKNVYWVSNQYQRTADKPYPKYEWSFDQAFNTSAYKLTATWAGANLYMYEGTVKDGKYYVDYLMTLDAKLESYHSYLLVDQGVSGVPNYSYSPLAEGTLKRISLVTPSAYDPYHYQPNGNLTDRNNYRGIFVSYFYKEDKTEGTNLMFTPWSTANTYAHISNNKEKVTLGSDSVLAYYPYDSSKPGYVTPTLTDIRQDTTKQTVNPLTLTKKSGNSINVYKNNDLVFPWMQKQFKMNEIYYNIVNDATGESLPIKYGVKLCETTEDGTLEIKVRSDQPGICVFHIGNAISSWPKTANLKDDTNKMYSTKDLVANEEGKVEFDCKKGEKVWFVYCGANSNGCQVEFTSIKQTKKT